MTNKKTSDSKTRSSKPATGRKRTAVLGDTTEKRQSDYGTSVSDTIAGPKRTKPAQGQPTDKKEKK